MRGIIVVNKPRGWTSMDVCAKLRGVFREKRVGHAGTLDPMATGVLPVFVGRATRAAQYAETGKKEYVAGLRLGVETNTQDIWGEVTRETPPPAVTPKELREALSRFTGEIEQLPPMYSAVKINGRKLYELARKGMEVERKPRKVIIYTLEQLEPGTEGDLRLRVVCSKGTYIRALCHDIGRSLGCGGCMSSLTRTAACGFTLDQAHTMEEIAAHPKPERLLLPTDTLFSDRPAYTAPPRQEERFRHGGNVSVRLPDGEVRVYAQSGEFLLLGRVDRGNLSILKTFYEG